MKVVLTLLLLALAPQLAADDDITRIWLTHRSNDPSQIVVNWMTDEPGDSVVQFGLSSEYGETVRIDENTTLHHVEIPLKHRNPVYHYSVSSGDQRSKDATFKNIQPASCAWPFTGFGYFAERAEVDGFPYYNTSLSGRGDQYADPQSKFLAGEDSYVLLTVERGGKMAVDIKSLEGKVLDRQEYERRKEQP